MGIRLVRGIDAPLIRLIPLALSVIAVDRLWDLNYTVLGWAIIGVTILGWLVRKAIFINDIMELEGKGHRKANFYWGKISVLIYVINCAIAIYGLMKTF